MVLIYKAQKSRFLGQTKSFPSPCGDYGSYQEKSFAEMYELPECFRPLAGIMVLIDKYIYRIGNEVVGVSVPLRGLWFLSSAKL